MDLLARREHSCYELTRKLTHRFGASELIRGEVERLRDEKLQSDSRYAEVYLRSRAQKLYGPQRIKSELRERGINDALINDTFAQSDIDWAANQQKLLQNKFGVNAPLDFKEKAMRLRFLQYRGFVGIDDL
ncbi:MAG: recombinase RecX [Verrucomicrobiaceae bacterium]|nr:recombinase RecX [Verrucomicrobiaceae bacterium]